MFVIITFFLTMQYNYSIILMVILMKLITFEDIVNLNVSPKECYSWVADCLKKKNECILPPKISIKPTTGVFCNVMPSLVKVDNKTYGGVKVVTRYPSRIPSLDSTILLFDADTGEKLAFMDGNWITAMRTGAVAAHSINLLAKKNIKEIGIMGLGNTARAALLSFLENLNNDNELNIKLLKYKKQEEQFANQFSKYKNVKFLYVDTAEKLVENSDVIISAATYLSDDVCKDNSLFKEGVLVVPIHTLGFTNCDLFFDKVFADDYGHVKNFKYFDKFKSFSEVSDVLNGVKVGRENDKERILVYNIGISIHDIYFAANIYKKMKDNKSLTDIDLKEPVEKFWIK